MIKSILLKEWNKTKLYFYSLILLMISMLVYFAYNLKFEFETIEPETMMWYRFVFLDFKPYEYFKWIFFLNASVIALAQFLPERIKNRVKILTHLPLSLSKVLALHVGVGFAFLVLISTIFIFTCSGILGFYYPNVIINVFYIDSFFYAFGAMIFYLGLTSAVLEKRLKIAILKLFVSLFALWIYAQSELNANIFLWIFVFIFFVFLTIDSLKSVKEQRVDKKILAVFSVVTLAILGVNLKSVYFENTIMR